MTWRSKILLGVVLPALCALGTTPALSHSAFSATSLTAYQQAKVRPVILVHGLGSTFDRWHDSGTVYHALQADGYDISLVRAFAYPDGPGQEDSTGDVRIIAEGLAQEIASLSQASQAAGGPADVDLVVHSLGGLVTRQYLAQRPGDHHVGKFIDIGTPHSGSVLMAIYNHEMDDLADDLADVPVLDWVTRQVVDDVVHGIWEWADLPMIPDPTTPAAQQLDPNGQFIRALNQPNLSPMDVDYSMIYGDISLQVGLDLFGINVLSQEIASLGDAVVSRDNAATIPYLGSRQGPNPDNYHTYGFQAPLVVGIELNPFEPDLVFPDLPRAIQEVSQVLHIGLVTNPEVNRRILQILNDEAPGVDPTPTPTRYPSQAPSPATASSATVLVMDISGSMDNSLGGSTKLDAAKSAGQDILTMIGQESQMGDATHEIGVVTFSSGARQNTALTTDYAAAESVMDGLVTDGSTNIGAGLELANETLADQIGSDAQRTIILLSDGFNNVGMANEEILAGPVQLAANTGTCIYTVGFGNPGDYDQGLLQNIASSSGCGSYYDASAADQLRRIYIRLRHESVGANVIEFAGQVSQGEGVEVGTYVVQPGTSQIAASHYWCCSRLDLIVTDPRGRKVDDEYSGAFTQVYENLIYLIVNNPLAGTWRIATYGADVPEGILDYETIVSVREGAAPPLPRPVPWSWVLPLGALLLVVAYSVLQQSRTRARAADAQLVVTAGHANRRAMPMGRHGLLIGRDTICDLVLAEPRASTRHARITRTPQGYTITDLGSMNGTFVNGQPIARAMIQPGDTIRIGHTELSFQAGGMVSPPRDQALAHLVLAQEGIAPRRYPIHGAGVTVGRDPSCHICLADPTVSRQHARIEVHGSQHILTDLDSTSGTFVSGRQVSQHTLRPGDDIRIGKTHLRFMI